MALASINQNFERVANATFYLSAYPTAGYTGTTLTTYVKSLYQLFYTDGDARKALTAGVLPWANLNADGISVKIKQPAIEAEGQFTAKHPIGFSPIEIDGEVSFFDVDHDHLKDALSSTTGEVMVFAPATGKAGRTTVAIGGSAKPSKYALMLRMPSQNVTGEFDHYIFPRVVFAVDTDLKFNKKDPQLMKLKFSAIQDQTFINPDTGLAEAGFMDIVTAAGL